MLREYKDVLSTSAVIPPVTVSVDTVYVRTNINKHEDGTFIGWKYDEIQYKKDNYIELISNKNIELNQSMTKQGIELSEREINEIMMGMQISDMEITLLELQMGGN